MKRLLLIAAMLCSLFATNTAKAQYCQPDVFFWCTDDAFEYINRFRVANLDYSSPCTSLGYNDFSSTQSASVTAGGVYTWTVNTTYPYGLNVIDIWVDYNNDFDFADANEHVVIAAPAGTGTATGSLTVASVAPGNYRMRVGLTATDDISPADPCETGYFAGEFEDYTLTVISTSFESTCGLALSIPDGGCSTNNNANVTIPVSGMGILNSGYALESVEINMTHPWVADLDITLVAPDGSVVLLSDDNGGSGDNYGDVSGCTINTRFIMSAATAITAGAAPFTGDFIPEGDLNSFNANYINGDGNWTLRVCDDTGDDFGTVNFVKLNFIPQVVIPPVYDNFQTACTVGVAIPDAACPNSTIVAIPVSGISTTLSATPTPGTHTLESVEVIITHGWDGDLDFSLRSPSGTVVELSTDNGGSGDNYGAVTGTCDQTTKFIMTASTPITAGIAPFIGSYLPEQNLNNFNNGQNPNGNWELLVCDDDVLITGTVQFVKLNFINNVPPPVTYCTPNQTTGTCDPTFDIWTANTTFNTINNNSGCDVSGYQDFTSISTTVSQGVAYNLSVTKGGSTAFTGDRVVGWIDFNIDGDFDDAGEFVLDVNVPQLTLTGNATVTIPLTSTIGTTTMRVMSGDNSELFTPCGPKQFAEWEDYTIVIQGAPSCLAPTALSVSNITTTDAQLNWNLVGGAVSYDVQYRAVGDPNWIFVGNFLDPTTSTIINGLSAQTAYEFQVQSRCGVADTSGYSIAEQFSTSCFDCPVGAVAEAESCGGDTNGGCITDPVAPPIESATVGTPICGTAWSNGDFDRDTDWYSFTIANEAVVTINVQSDFPAQIGFFDPATVCSSGQLIQALIAPGNCVDTTISYSLCAGTYGAFIAVDFNVTGATYACGNLNNYTLTITEAPLTGNPANDFVCDAIELPVGVSCSSQTFDNTTAIYCPSDINPGCSFGGPQNFQSQDVWFYFVVPATGEATVTTSAGTLSDGLMAAYTGVDCNNLTVLDCNDDFNGLMPQLNLSGMTPGDTIWVQMAGWQGAIGTFGICVYDCDVVPGGNTPEAEACLDNDNGGCNNIFDLGTAPTYQSLSCNEVIDGTAWYDGFSRDTDWYTYTLTTTTSVSWSVVADFIPAVYIVDITDCNNAAIIAAGPVGNPCDVITAQAVLGPGTYAFFVGADFNNPAFDCFGGNGDYIATLNVSTPDPSIFAQANACLSDAPFTIATANPGGTFSSNGAGITDALNGVFDPAAAGVGTWDVYYSLTVNGCTIGDTISITIQDVPAVSSSPISGNTALCINPLDETYTVATIADADSYNWILTPTNAGTVTGTGASVVVNFDNAFSGTASLVVAGVNECGTGAFSTSLDIVVTPLPGQAGTPAGPDNLCQGAPDTDYTTAGDPASTTYAWTIVTNPANGATISGTGSTGTVTWDPNFVGTADISVTGSNSCGTGASSAVYTVTINATTPSSIDPVTVACANSSVQLTATPAGGTFSGTDVTSGGLFTPSGAGTYTILYTPAGGCSSPSTLTVQVGDVPATPATPIGITSQCQGGPNTTVFVIPVSGATSYTWSVTPAGAFTNVNTSVDGQVTVTWDPQFFGQAEFIVSATNGCGTSLFSGMHIITINPNPVAQITPSGPYCVSDQCFQLSADQQGFWSSNCASSLTSDGLFCPSVAGTCDVSITVVANGCQGTATSQVTVQPAVVADIVTPGTICEDDAVITLVGSPAGGTFSPSATFDPSQGPGDYDVTYTVTGGNGCDATTTETITVNGLPVAAFSYSAQCQALTFFNESQYGEGASYFWEFGDGIESSAENTSHVYNTDGTVAVTLTVTNACGTADTTVNVVIIKCVGVDENVVDQLSLFPNPTNGLVNVFFTSGKAQNYMLNVVDVTGKVLYTENLTNFVGQYNNPIDFSRFAAGMYIFRIVGEDGRATNVKVVRD